MTKLKVLVLSFFTLQLTQFDSFCFSLDMANSWLVNALQFKPATAQNVL
jgi:hypothetical protein